MNLPIAITNFYVQEYRDINLNSKLGKNRTYLGGKVRETLIWSHLRPKMTYFLPIFFWAKSGKFENGKKPRISTSTILTIFLVKK